MNGSEGTPQPLASAGGMNRKVKKDDILLTQSDRIVKSPLKAIRAHCLSCCAGYAGEVRLCTIKACDLFPYRFGSNPNRRGIGQKTPTQHRISERDRTGLSVGVGGIS
jgi:hypothetical protein